jgi:hypothetical protein
VQSIDQKLREEYLKTVQPAGGEDNNIDVARQIYFNSLVARDPNTETELLKRAGFKLQVEGTKTKKPLDYAAYKSLVMDNTE